MVYNPYELLEGDYAFIEGVEDAQFAYGPDRYTTGLPTPDGYCKVRLGNPTQKQLVQASMSTGWAPTDRILTIWQPTLKDSGGTLIRPVEGDKFTIVNTGVLFLVAWIKDVIYGVQYVAYCKQSTATNENTVGMPRFNMPA